MSDTELVLPNNDIGDAGVEGLVKDIEKLPNLTFLNISRNNFTFSSAKHLSLHLATHLTRIKYLNLSYNQLGDGAAAIVSLLMFNHPSHLVGFDISFCGVRDAGIKEITVALPSCPTLRYMNVKGSFVEPVVMTSFLEAVALHHQKFTPNRLSHNPLRSLSTQSNPGLLVQFGGSALQGNKLKSLSFRSAKASFPYVDKNTLLHSVALRRRLPYIYLPYAGSKSTGGHAFSNENWNSSNQFQLSLEDEKLMNFSDYLSKKSSSLQHTTRGIGEEIANNTIRCESFLVCLRLQFSAVAECAEELMEILSVLLGADSRQLRVLSVCSELIGWPQFLDPGSSRDNINNRNRAQSDEFSTYSMDDQDATVVSDADENEAELGNSSNSKTNASAPPHNFLIFALQDPQSDWQHTFQSRCLVPGVHKEGIDAVQLAFQNASSEFSVLPSARRMLEQIHQWASQSAPALTSLGISTVYLQHSHLLVQLDKQKFVKAGDCVFEPPRLAQGFKLKSNTSISGSPADSVLSPTGGRRKYAPSALDRDRTPFHSEVPYDERNFDPVLWEKLASDSFATTMLKKLGRGASEVMGSLWCDVSVASQGSTTSASRAARQQREEALARAAEKKEKRIVAERIIAVIRDLRRSNSFDSTTAKLWEAAVGNNCYRDLLVAAQFAAVSEYGMFRGVYLRRCICDAMLLQDMTKLQIAIEKMEASGCDGGHALLFGKRLISELTFMKKFWSNVEKIGNNFNHLEVVESFLLICARIGYQGSEMFSAVEIRQNLIDTALQARPHDTQDALGLIQAKALLTNLMISRDFTTLSDEIEELMNAGDDSANNLQEMYCAKALMKEMIKSNKRLKKAIESSNLEALENAISQASYFGLHSDLLNRAVAVAGSLEKDAAGIMDPMVKGLMNDDESSIVNSLNEMTRVGWIDDSINLVVLRKILAGVRQLVKKEAIKGSLIRFSNAIKSGNTSVNLGEMYHLVKRTIAEKLDSDFTLQAHLEVLLKKIKKSPEVGAQYLAIERMINNVNIEGLTELLSGRGSGRLVMCVATPELLKMWMTRIQKICSMDNGANSMEVSMSGTMEKAARSDTGKLRGWRRRYFVLQGSNLSYYTQLGGTRKGIVRIRGGTIRQMHPSETGGKLLCLELQEGRDLSLLDPEQLVEARRLVNEAKRVELEESLTDAMEDRDIPRLITLVNDIAGSGIGNIDFLLLRKCQSMIQSSALEKLKKELMAILKHVPKGQVEIVLSRADNLFLEPMHGLYQAVSSLSTRSEMYLSLLRARNTLILPTDHDFRRAFGYLNRFESKKFTQIEKRLLVALMLQHCGFRLMTSHFHGESLSSLDRLLKHSLTCCANLHIETEVMQLTRLIMLLSGRYSAHAANFQQVTVDKRLEFNAYIDEDRLFGEKSAMHTIDKYDGINTTEAAGGILSSLLKSKPVLAKGQSQAAAMMKFTPNSISKSLLRGFDGSKSKPSVISQIELCRLFDALQVVMGDRPLSAIASSRSASKAWYITGKNKDEVEVAVELVNAGLKQPLVVDELYLQLCKQLTENPQISSRLKGWLLFSIYLHYFAPTQQLIPFVINFVSAANGAVQQELTVNSTGTIGEGVADVNLNPDDNEKLASASKIIPYCLRLLSAMSSSYSKRATKLSAEMLAATLSDKNDNSSHGRDDAYPPIVPTRIVNKEILGYALNQIPIGVEILTMTGSLFHIDIQYGDLNTPFSLLPLLHNRMTGMSEAALTEMLLAKQQQEAELSGKLKEDHAQCNDRDLISLYMLKLFRGFGLYYESPHDDDDEEEKEDRPSADSSATPVVKDSPVDAMELHSVPIQPEEVQFIPWDQDFVWDLMEQKVVEQQSTHSDTGRASNISRVAADTLGLVLRRRVGASTEKFESEYDLFGDITDSADILTRNKNWSSWLQSSNCYPMPMDTFRMDLLFAEETRYFNCGLYGGDDESKTHLLGLQLALSWEDLSCSEWGQGHDQLFNGIELSVRPCHQSNDAADYWMTLRQADPMDEANVADGRLRGNSVESHNSVYHDDAENNGSNAEEASAAAGSGDSGSESHHSSEYDEDSEEESLDEYDAEYTGKGYSSSDDSSRIEPSESNSTVEVVPPKAPVTNFDDLCTRHVEEIEEKLAIWGIDNSDEDFVRSVVDKMIAFHRIALDNNISTRSPRYRYLLKRAYLQYLMSFPLYCSHLSSARLLIHPASAPPNNPISKKGRNVLVSISAAGVSLLQAEDWSLVLFFPHYDIELISAMSVPPGKRKVEPIYDSMLQLNVNGMITMLETNCAEDIMGIIEAYSVDCLSWGNFPLGTETSVHNNMLEVASSPLETRSKAALQQYLHLFSLLPSTPLPPSVTHSKYYFAPPRSKREILAEERAKEEMMEEMMARFAADTQAEKNQMKLEEGRKDIHRFDSDDYGSDVSDEENANRGNGGGERGGKDRNSKRRGTRRAADVRGGRLSVFANADKLKSQISSSACGIPMRKSRVEFTIPTAPIRRGGRLQLDMRDRINVEERPQIAPSLGENPYVSLPPLALQWPSPNSPYIESMNAALANGPQSGSFAVPSHTQNNAKSTRGIQSTVIEDYKSAIVPFVWSAEMVEFPQRLNARLVESEEWEAELLADIEEETMSDEENLEEVDSNELKESKGRTFRRKHANKLHVEYTPWGGVYGHLKSKKRRPPPPPGPAPVPGSAGPELEQRRVDHKDAVGTLQEDDGEAEEEEDPTKIVVVRPVKTAPRSQPQDPVSPPRDEDDDADLGPPPNDEEPEEASPSEGSPSLSKKKKSFFSSLKPWKKK